MPEYQKVKVVVFDEEWPFDRGATLNAVTEWFQARLAEIPVEYRYEAECEANARNGYDEDGGYAIIEISYRRPETPAEWGERVARDEASEARRRARDIDALRALRAKYPEEG